MVYDNGGFIGDDPLEKGVKPGLHLGDLENGRVPEVSLKQPVRLLFVFTNPFFHLFFTDTQNGTDIDEKKEPEEAKAPQRDNWGSSLEFLMSCIAMSVGLGNVWRFPFIALENGGGAFLIPYLIVLAIVGRPIYYLEMVIGQFSSRGSAKVYDLCPALRGE